MAWGRLVVKARLFLKSTWHLFMNDRKLYRLCEGLNRMELNSLSLRACERQYIMVMGLSGVQVGL